MLLFFGGGQSQLGALFALLIFHGNHRETSLFIFGGSMPTGWVAFSWKQQGTHSFFVVVSLGVHPKWVRFFSFPFWKPQGNQLVFPWGGPSRLGASSFFVNRNHREKPGSAMFFFGGGGAFPTGCGSLGGTPFCLLSRKAGILRFFFLKGGGSPDKKTHPTAELILSRGWASLGESTSAASHFRSSGLVRQESNLFASH